MSIISSIVQKNTFWCLYFGLLEFNITDCEALYSECSWMKEIDEIGLFLCRAQANLFVASLTLIECSSAVVLRRFMNSSVAGRMDKAKNITTNDY